MSNVVNNVTNINNIHQLVAAIGEHIPALIEGEDFTVGPGQFLTPVKGDEPLADDEVLDWGANQMYLVKDSENGDFFMVNWEGCQYHVRPEYAQDAAGITKSQAFNMYATNVTPPPQDGGFAELTTAQSTDKFDELFDVNTGVVDLNSLGQLFAYFGPPAAVNLILGVLQQRVESLTDMVEDLRAAQAEAETVAVETNRIAREVAEEAEAIRNSVDAEAEAIREEVRQAAKGSKKSSCLPSPLATLVICGCGLLVGYGIRKIFR